MQQMRSWELFRVVTLIPLKAAESLFLLLAIQLFHADPTAKALIVAATFIGLLISPLTTSVISALKLPAAKGISYAYRLSALALVFANLSTKPLRTEYIAGGESFEAYSPTLVLLIVEVIPTICCFISVFMWGRLFDKVNFLRLRIGINLLFGLSIGLFFTEFLSLQLLSAALFGVAFGGGSIAWNLWVTKYAPKDKTADYMAVHSFLTGLRGVLGPMIALHAIAFFSYGALAVIATGLCILSAIAIIPVINYRELTD